jgi:fatty-acyl-CoA synthase
MTVVEIADDALESAGRVVDARPGRPSRRMVRLGRPVPGLEIRIVDPETGAPRAPREVGELEIRGSSVTPGYYPREDLAAESFRDGWLRTGDLAYVVDGELVVCGRRKDVIIVGGRNIFPDDIERAVGTLDGVRAGNVIAFGVAGRNGKENIVIVAETKADDHELVAKFVTERVRDVIGIPPKDVVLVTPSALPKTSSGKLQRAACRERYLAGTL